jgi:hypothetical protein
VRSVNTISSGVDGDIIEVTHNRNRMWWKRNERRHAHDSTSAS